MLIILLTSLGILTLVTLISRRRPWSIDAAQLGSVSAQWLAEYRASHPS